jgi:hypothetical protein
MLFGFQAAQATYLSRAQVGVESPAMDISQDPTSYREYCRNMNLEFGLLRFAGLCALHGDP